MKWAAGLAGLGLLAMSLALAHGFIAGDFVRDGGVILSNPWGRVSLVDLYVGFMLFSGWVFYREQSALRAAVWVVLVLVLGFFAASLYALLAVRASGGDWGRFWQGERASS